MTVLKYRTLITAAGYSSDSQFCVKKKIFIPFAITLNEDMNASHQKIEVSSR